MPQSFSRNCTVPWPMPRSSASSVMAAVAASDVMPSYLPELNSMPSFDVGVVERALAGASPSAGRITGTIGRLYFCAKSKSRSSCAGTPITAPVPYSPST